MAGGPNEEPTSRGSGSSTDAGGGGMTLEECENMIRRSLRDPKVRFLKEHLEKSGCGIGSNFIKAVNCDTAAAGGYVPGEGIIVCRNYLKLQDEVTQVVIHELIHAYDDCRAANLDWTNCAHHACSEIRAGHLSGDCHYKRELLRGYIKMRGHEQMKIETPNVGSKLHFISRHETLHAFRTGRAIPDCVRRRVMQSLGGNPACSETASKDAMEAVWDTCYNDTKPFDRAP